MKKFSIAMAKYGDQAQLSSTMTMRPSMAVYVQRVILDLHLLDHTLM